MNGSGGGGQNRHFGQTVSWGTGRNICTVDKPWCISNTGRTTPSSGARWFPMVRNGLCAVFHWTFLHNETVSNCYKNNMFSESVTWRRRYSLSIGINIICYKCAEETIKYLWTFGKSIPENYFGLKSMPIEHKSQTPFAVWWNCQENTTFGNSLYYSWLAFIQM